MRDGSVDKFNVKQLISRNSAPLRRRLAISYIKHSNFFRRFCARARALEEWWCPLNSFKINIIKLQLTLRRGEISSNKMWLKLVYLNLYSRREIPLLSYGLVIRILREKINPRRRVKTSVILFQSLIYRFNVRWSTSRVSSLGSQGFTAQDRSSEMCIYTPISGSCATRRPVSLANWNCETFIYAIHYPQLVTRVMAVTRAM